MVNSEYRWRRDCTTDGSELVVNSEARGGEGGPGCRQAGQYDSGGQVGKFSSDIVKVFVESSPPGFYSSQSLHRIVQTIRHTLCVCNSTLCNTHKNDMSGAGAAAAWLPAILALAAACLAAR